MLNFSTMFLPTFAKPVLYEVPTETINRKTKRKKEMAKINTYQHSMIYDIVNHMREKGLPDETAGYLRFLLEDNILMNIKIDGKLYKVAWRYWVDYIHAFGSCCGSCDEDSLAEVERSKKELLKNAIELTDHALDY